MFQRPLGIGLNDKPHLLHHIYIIIPRTPCMWLLLREGFMPLVFIHPLLLSNCYLAQTLHFWWKDHFGVEPSFWLQIPRIYRRFGQFTDGPAHKLGRLRIFFFFFLYKLVTTVNCNSWYYRPGFGSHQCNATFYYLNHYNSRLCFAAGPLTQMTFLAKW